MRKITNSFLKINYNSFINSIKNINFNIAIMVFYDILFYFFSGLFIYSSFKYLEKKASVINLPDNILELSIQQAEFLSSNLKGLYFLIIFMAIFLILLLVLNLSLFKGLNWSLAAKKEFNFKSFKKFLLLNLAWVPFWILLLFLVFIGINPNAINLYLLTILLIAIYLTNILYALFTKENSFNIIKKTLKIAFAKIHYFIVPYSIMIFLLYLLSKILTFNLQQRISFAISILILILVIAWFRLYIVEVVDSIA